mmetsp:Transcript_38713/g.93755  ORF Transcript_38713/g.93755 Transcript_38713/m.93755 type:complete len:250 (-) Transcript_38713:325-1074(-)
MTSSTSFKFFLFVFVAIMAISSSFVDAAEGSCDEATPCQNGGTCHFDDIRQVNYCHCPQGTAGKLCHGTNCPLTCRNGGSCRNGADDGGLEFFCECVGGYSGDSCECAPGSDCGSSSTEEVQVPASTSTGSSSSEKNGMNGFGKFLVSMVVIGSVIMFGFVLLRRRRYSASSNTGLDKDSAIREAETYEDSVVAGSPTYKDSAGDVEDAVKSIEQQQQASSFGGKGGQSTAETTAADILDGMDDVEDYN